MGRIKKQKPAFYELLEMGPSASWQQAGRVWTAHLQRRPATPRRETTVQQLLVDNVWAQTVIDGWRIAYRVGLSKRRPVISEMRLYPAEDRQPMGKWSAEELGILAPVPDGGITARLLRRITLGQHFAAIQQVDQKDLRAAAERGWLLPPKRPKQRSLPRRGRPQLPEGFYLELVKQYQRLVRGGDRSPCLTIANERGWKPERVRSAIARYRRRHEDLL